jgi:succinate-semialdehyde dehydrogenase/glutarate-semialdehyde dehydrogenase
MIYSDNNKRVFASINPYNNVLLKQYAEINEHELIEKINVAHQAFEIWKNTTFEHRANLILKVAEILLANKEEFAQYITLEMGKPIKESIAEIVKCTSACEHFAHYAKTYLQDEIVKTDASISYNTHEPLGVILGIMPWNFPFWQVFRYAVPALMAGNTVLLKHAPGVPQCAELVESIFIKAGFHEGIFQNLFISEEAVKTVIENSKVKMVSLTGSERAGAAVAAITGSNIKRSVLELGGSDPFIVLKDANINEAATWAVNARFQNSGQSCIAGKRFIVEKELVQPFTELVLQQVQQLVVGNPIEATTNIGPLANERQAVTINNQIERAIAEGAHLIYGGNRPSITGAFVNPTILTNIKPGMIPFEEEIFGPVMSIIEAENETHAIELANSTKFGLGASLWTTDIGKAKILAKEISAGAVFINAMVKSDPRMPFGGINASGYGKELGSYGIKEFVNTKSICIN